AGGGRCEGRAIPTVGYRGMHSFAVAFEDFFVPEENRIGEEGQGFYLQMKGFEGGRIQTAARAVGVMEAAFRAALGYVKDRVVFGRSLAEFTLTQAKIAEMAARIQAGRQLAYRVGAAMDAGEGSMEASLVKFLVCRDAEWVTREAMQLHGGMGYSEEYAVSRYWLDARVLSIFEGAEEVLGLLVIARQHLAKYL
ncbi:MAG: acyl-CoA dehydrogenase, partial [Deltaproteobacteria bacterium]